MDCLLTCTAESFVFLLLPKSVMFKHKDYDVPCCFVKPVSLALRKEHRLRMFENRVRRKIFRPKMRDRRLEIIAHLLC
jgi:hypothetical protein